MRIVILILVSVLFSSMPVSAGQAVDNAIYASLLKKYTVKGRVNYRGIKKDEQKLDTYLAILSNTDVGSLSRTEQFAFYINAYNAFTIKLILTRYPGINSIKETGSFFTNPWQKEFILLQGHTVDLDHIEHGILRPSFKDPRVHFAINCASKSCARLRSEPYEASILENQLNDQTKNFINNRKHIFFKDNTLFLNKIFKWFSEDFSDNPVQFIRQYADNDLKKAILSAGRDIKIAYLSYDWSLNQ